MSLAGAFLLAAGCGPVGCSPAPAPPPVLPRSVTYHCNGFDHLWFVPSDVNIATFDAVGAQGGEADPAHPGGLGGEAKATFPVNPNSQLVIAVGCGWSGAGAANGHPGYGLGFGGFSSSPSGGGGGGGSGIVFNPFTIPFVPLVAGGGGGGTVSARGGAGGGSEGQPATAGEDAPTCSTPLSGGQPGVTQASLNADGGVVGAGGVTSTPNCLVAGGTPSSGDFDGASGADGTAAGGGGGGGGNFGAGGGAAGIDGAGGGGGSGLCLGVCGQSASGVGVGDGTVTITYVSAFAPDLVGTSRSASSSSLPWRQQAHRGSR